MRNNFRNILAIIFSLLLFTVIALSLPNKILWGSEVESMTLDEFSFSADSDGNCRFGVAVMQQDQLSYLDTLGSGWFLNFGISSGPASNGAEFTPMIRVFQNKSSDGEYLEGYFTLPELTDIGLGSYVDARPGAVWIVGNEVDRGPNPNEPDPLERGQGDTFPDVYAQAYHDVYHFIKSRDPSAKVANSGLVQVTPGRLEYLEQVWDSYISQYGTPIPVDVWTMHLYILPEVNPNGEANGIANVALGTDPAFGRRESGGNAGLCHQEEVYCYAEHDDMNVFAEQIIDMRTWMKEHGEQYKPLLITEYSILYPYEDHGETCFIQDEYGNCFTEQRVTNFLGNSMDYLLSASDTRIGYPPDNHRLVQQWLWWSIYQSNVGYVSNLFESDGELNAVGQAYIDEVQSSANQANLFPSQVALVGARTVTETVDVEIWTQIRNNGNVTSGPFSVSFYEDAGLNNLIGTVEVPGPNPGYQGLTGCGWREVKATITWPDVPPGLHRYWVEVDSADEIPEIPGGGEADNIAEGIVIVDGYGLLAPIYNK